MRPATRLATAVLIVSAFLVSTATAQSADPDQGSQTPVERPEVTAGRDGVSVRTPDGTFQLSLRGYMQSDGRFFLDDSRNGTDEFVLRRVRPIVEGTLFRLFGFRLAPDFGLGTATLQDGYLDARLHSLVRIRMGKFKSPVGLERLTTASDLLFVERALPTALVPNRDVGIVVHGDWKSGMLTYMGGVLNGTVDGGSADVDDHDGKDVAARVFALPFKTDRRSWLQGLGVGLAGSYGIERGTQTAPALPVLRTSGQEVFFRFRTNTADGGAVVADGARYRVSPQGYYYAGSTGFVVEHVLSAQEIRRSAATLTVRNTAWQIAASHVVTGEKATPRGVAPTRPFDRSAGGWGAFQLAVRFSTLGVADEVFPVFADPSTAAREARAVGVGLNWYLNTNVKVSAEYERSTFEGGAPGGDRPAELHLFTRFQLAF